MGKYKLQIMGASKSKSTEEEETRRTNGDYIIYSGHKYANVKHEHGVTILKSKKVKRYRYNGDQSLQRLGNLEQHRTEEL